MGLGPPITPPDPSFDRIEASGGGPLRPPPLQPVERRRQPATALKPHPWQWRPAKAANPGSPGPDPVPTLSDLGCWRRDGDVTASGGGSPVPRSGARVAMPEHGTRTRCIHGAWFRRGAGRAGPCPGPTVAGLELARPAAAGSSSTGCGGARARLAGGDVAVQPALGQEPPWPPRRSRGARRREGSASCRSFKPCSPASLQGRRRLPVILGACAAPTGRELAGRNPSPALCRCRQQRHLQVPFPPWRCCFKAFPPTCWYGRACAGWSDAGWDGSVRRNPSPALAGAVTDDALRCRGPPWR
uniref:Uncharacterized protein n=1 Tax=Setaria viridis TaxID=4556 RepID=A0A4V6D3C4_SETVI|nr:hypothetical protein SEVIR_8G225000v2 [Setaria viridis]